MNKLLDGEPGGMKQPPRRYKSTFLPSRVHMIIPSRLLIAVWMITWVTTVPLFHTHLPDSSDRQACQGGVPHTVFSPDLPGEFSRVSNTNNHDHFPHVSSRVLNSPELNFAISSEHSNDREVKQLSVLGFLCYLPHWSSRPTAAIESRAIHGRLLVVAGPQGSRAPPSVVSL